MINVLRYIVTYNYSMANGMIFKIQQENGCTRH